MANVPKRGLGFCAGAVALLALILYTFWFGNARLRSAVDSSPQEVFVLSQAEDGVPASVAIAVLSQMAQGRRVIHLGRMCWYYRRSGGFGPTPASHGDVLILEQAQAIEFLGGFGASALSERDVLLPLLEHPNWEIRVRAALALWNITGDYRMAAKTLREMLLSPSRTQWGVALALCQFAPDAERIARDLDAVAADARRRAANGDSGRAVRAETMAAKIRAATAPLRPTTGIWGDTAP